MPTKELGYIAAATGQVGQKGIWSCVSVGVVGGGF